MNKEETKSNITVLTAQTDTQRQASILADRPRLVLVTQDEGKSSSIVVPQLQLLVRRN